jgi:hypothetical protein
MLSKDYQTWLTHIKAMIVQSQTKALVSVNQALLSLYWNIGKTILEKQALKGWGAKIVDNLAQGLSLAFPDSRGFSVRNLKNMRKFAEAYPDFSIVQPVSAQLSWTHHIILLDKFSDERLRGFGIYSNQLNKAGLNEFFSTKSTSRFILNLALCLIILSNIYLKLNRN